MCNTAFFLKATIWLAENQTAKSTADEYKLYNLHKQAFCQLRLWSGFGYMLGSLQTVCCDVALWKVSLLKWNKNCWCRVKKAQENDVITGKRFLLCWKIISMLWKLQDLLVGGVKDVLGK